MQIGFIGTGTMGTPIAGCLIRAGHTLSVYDRRPDATHELCAQGATHAETAFAAARNSQVVFTSLPGPAEFEAAMLEPQTGILAGLQPGTTHIDLTTNAPATIARVAEACRARGVDLIDAPVSGRPPTMTVMVGASDTAFATCRPLFAVIAANVFHVGPSGAGATAKLVTQYLGYTNFIASIEGMLVAAKAGIDLRRWRGSCRSAPGKAAPSTTSRAACFRARSRPVARLISLPRIWTLPASSPAMSAPRPRWVRLHPTSTGAPRRPAGAGLVSRGCPRAGGDGRNRIAAGRQSRRQGMTEDRVALLLLTQEIAGFLYAEAELLDERRYDDWLALLADDIRYWMPMRRNVKYGDTEREFTRETEDISWFDEGRETLARRVTPDPDRHPLGGGAAVAHHPHGLQRAASVGHARRRRAARGRGQVPLPDLPQPRGDRDRPAGRQARGHAAPQRCGWLIARRKIILDQNVLLTKNLTFFF